MSHPNQYYRPEGNFGPICDAIIIFDDGDAPGPRRLGPPDDDDDEDIFGPFDGDNPIYPLKKIVCKKDPETGELYNCRPVWDPGTQENDFPMPPCTFQIAGECFDWPGYGTKEWGLKDDFFVPPINPTTCNPFRNDINIAPITRVNEDGSTTKLYPRERSTPVTYAAYSGEQEVPTLDVQFSDDGTKLVVRGDQSDTGTVVLTLKWDDDPTNHSTALGQITLNLQDVDTGNSPTTWTQSNIYDAAALPGATMTGVALLYYGNGVGEIGQFAPPEGNTSATQYFAFGTPTTSPFSSMQTTRRVDFTADLTGSRTLFVHAISGNDRNGGERINNSGEGLRVIWPDNSEEVLLPSRQDWREDNPGASNREYDDNFDNWSLLAVNIPNQYRTSGVAVKLQQNIVAGPEFQREDIEVYFNSAGDLVVDGNGDAEVTLKFEWDDNPNTHGVALGTWSANGITFTQTTGIPDGNDTQKMDVVAGNVYSATITGNSGGFSVEADDDGNTKQVLCFRDDDGNDCNATLTIHKVKKGVNTISVNNPNGGDAIGIAAVGWGGAASFEQAERGSESHRVAISANVQYPITFTDLNSNNQPIKVIDNGNKLCLKDSDGNDCNAEFFIEEVTSDLAPSSLGYWSDIANRYAVWVNPMVCTLPCLTQTVTYLVQFPTTDTYFFEFGVDDVAKVFFDEEEVPLLDVAGGIFRAGDLSTPYIVERAVTAGTHKIIVVCTNSNPSRQPRTLDGHFVSNSVVRRFSHNFVGPNGIITPYNWSGHGNFGSGPDFQKADGSMPSQWFYNVEGGQKQFWGSLSDTYTDTFDILTNGGGVGMRLNITIEAWPGAAGNPTNNRFRVNSIVNPGSGYEAGDYVWWSFQTPHMVANNIPANIIVSAIRINTTVNGSAYGGTIDLDDPNDEYTDTYGIYGFLNYTNPARYFTAIGKAVAEEYITGRFGRTETISGQYGLRGRAPDMDGHTAHCNYYVAQGGSRSDTVLNPTAWAATKQGIYDGYISSGEINAPNVVKTYYPNCEGDNPVGKEGTDKNKWAQSWTRNPGGWYMRICRGSPCKDTEVLDWVKSGPHNAWGDFMDEYAVFSSNFETYAGDPQSLTYRIDIPVSGSYDIEYASDNTMTIDWDGTNIITHSGFTSSSTGSFNFTAGAHQLTMTVTNQSGQPNEDRWDSNPAGGAWKMTKNPSNVSVYFDGDAGQLIAFSLYEDYDLPGNRRPGYFSKAVGESAKTSYGGRAELWSNENDFVQAQVSPTGGSGSGMLLTVRFDALLGAGGNPNNTSYKIVSIDNAGTGYQKGDKLSFPDISGKDISGGPFKLRIDQISKGDGSIIVEGVGTVDVDLDFDWDDASSFGYALGTWAIAGASFTKGNAESGSASKTVRLEGPGRYQAQIVRGSGYGGLSVQNNGTKLCFRDSDGTDCNATLEISNVVNIIRTSADLLDTSTNTNLIWHTRQAILYSYVAIDD